MQPTDAWSDWPEWLTDWPMALARSRFSTENHGDYPRWQAAIDAMPTAAQLSVGLPQLAAGAVGCSLGNSENDSSGSIDTELLIKLEACLQALHPWRKGPFQFGSIFIDTEWRSDWKWDRLADAVGSLTDQRILDIGSGNGYFGWRMLGAGAMSVVGIDPTLVFCMQHRAVQCLLRHPNHWVLPLGIEEIPATHAFDWVLSMGVLYHRKDPQEHIRQMYALTEAGGKCVMETLVVDGPASLYPEGRYARMRNISVIPSLAELQQWLVQAGYTNPQLIDLTPTTTEEQRSTPWMRFESLDKALDANNPSRTMEGWPAPLRAMIVAEKCFA